MKAKIVVHEWGTFVMIFCPGCEWIHELRIIQDGKKPLWTWNGDSEKPTFTPSLNHKTGKYADMEWFKGLSQDLKDFFEDLSTKCHSKIRDGKMQYLNDSTHMLAGTIVKLPDLPKRFMK